MIEHDPKEPSHLRAHLQASLSAFEVWGGDLEDARAVLQHLIDTISWRFQGAEGGRLKLTTAVDFYEREFYPLSNFSSFTLMWPVSPREILRFDTSEAAYHWEKFNGTTLPTDHIQAQIRLARSAHEAFKIAETNRKHRRPNWDDEKISVMRRIIRAKFDQHEYVRRKLLETGDRPLVEGSWRDDFWGIGPNRDGQNMLGKLWMQLRAVMQAPPIGSGDGR